MINFTLIIKFSFLYLYVVYMNEHIIKIHHQLINDKNLGNIVVGLNEWTIVITRMPPHISKYFTKIRLNYNPINKKIHLRTDSADEDIAKTFGIIDNDKQFNNGHEVIVFLNNIINQKQHHKKNNKSWIIILLILLIIFIIIYI
jgi:hypothetical protein